MTLPAKLPSEGGFGEEGWGCLARPNNGCRSLALTLEWMHNFSCTIQSGPKKLKFGMPTGWFNWIYVIKFSSHDEVISFGAQMNRHNKIKKHIILAELQNAI